MFRLLFGLTVVFALVAGIPPANAQEPLWSATMTAGWLDDRADDGILVGYYDGHPANDLEPFGALSDPNLEFGGVTYSISSLMQLLDHEYLEPGQILFAVSPLMDHNALERMTLTVDGYALPVSDNQNLWDEGLTLVAWSDPGFRWKEGQRVTVSLTMSGQPVPALPLAAAGALALLLALGAYRRTAGRN